MFNNGWSGGADFYKVGQAGLQKGKHIKNMTKSSTGQICLTMDSPV
jgi:hypothetical protein